VLGKQEEITLMLSNNKIIKVMASAGGKVAEQATTKPQIKGLNPAARRHHTKMERKTEKYLK
jgi:hypothetical protein